MSFHRKIQYNVIFEHVSKDQAEVICKNVKNKLGPSRFREFYGLQAQNMWYSVDNLPKQNFIHTIQKHKDSRKKCSFIHGLDNR
jgi:hypothetical protein